MSNETILVHDEQIVFHDNRFWSGNYDTVITNLAIVMVEKSISGKTKGVIRVPFNHIKMYNNQPVSIIKLNTFEISTDDGQLEYMSTSRARAKRWIENLCHIMNGRDIDIANASSGSFADDIKDSFMDAFGIFGIKEKLDDYSSSKNVSLKNVVGLNKQERVSRKCKACGAMLKGTKGTSVTCEYCGTKQVL